MITILSNIPVVKITPRDPLAAEMLEHWAAKLVVRGDPGDAKVAETVQAGARLFREWQKANP